jgi:hypothetical protein
MTPQDPSLFGIPVDFVLFGVPLAGVAIFHQCIMRVALTGLVTITIYKIGSLYFSCTVFSTFRRSTRQIVFCYAVRVASVNAHVSGNSALVAQPDIDFTVEATAEGRSQRRET